MEIDSKRDKVIFSSVLKKNWRDKIELNLKDYKKDKITFDLGEATFTSKDIIFINKVCQKQKIQIINIESTNPQTIISASGLGFKTLLNPKESTLKQRINSKDSNNDFKSKNDSSTIFLHQGTLRSGEVLAVNNDVLIVGDVNPGASVLAGGNVMIWGRLLGIAHAGKNGNIKAKITALQLRPVQLRIANKVARGPKEKPEEGLAEEARLEDDVIVIKPATTI
ncbi:septum site-determining protein MinC [Prochlorococcus sp. MIT 0603]|nr:septum site-determining protein MinC [Prochlorococcus sp. MIT 0603]KGG16595.1 Septum site-determining protein MinC [Prochlorococcus sp. MIT 0602]